MDRVFWMSFWSNSHCVRNVAILRGRAMARQIDSLDRKATTEKSGIEFAEWFQ
jgi:hypothetical protein